MQISLKLAVGVRRRCRRADEVARRLTAVGSRGRGDRADRARGSRGVVVARILASEKHPNAEKLSVTRVDAGGAEPLADRLRREELPGGRRGPARHRRRDAARRHRRSRRRSSAASSRSGCCARRASSGSPRTRAGCSSSTAASRRGRPSAEALGLEDVRARGERHAEPARRALARGHRARGRRDARADALRLPRPALREAGAPAVGGGEDPHRGAGQVRRATRRASSRASRSAPRRCGSRDRLEACGVRSISNVVDVTNFVLLELGQPLHAFDLDKVGGPRDRGPHARGRARRSSPSTARSGRSTPDDLLIADRDRGSALAGVMGGGDSEISAGTTRVLLESRLVRAGRRSAARRAATA